MTIRCKAGGIRAGREQTRVIGTRLAIGAVALGLVLGAAMTSFAQNDSEAPKTLPEMTIAPAGGSGPSAPEESPVGAASAPAETIKPVSKPVKHKMHPTSHKTIAYTGEVESGSGMLKLTEDGWAYASPSKSAAHVQAVHAGKFLHVTGTTAHYVQIKLKSGTTAYVPMTAVELAKPADKIFRLTKDTPVLAVPNQHGKKLAEVHAGHDVQVVGMSVNYMKIRMKDGLEGFISVNALE